MSSINILCPFHSKVVNFLNIDLNVKIGDRVACDECGLIRPISIVTGLEIYNRMATQQNSQIDRLLDQEVKTLEKLKNKLYKKTEELLQNIKSLEKEIEVQIQKTIQNFKNLKLTQYQIGQTTLSQLQKMAQQISLYKNQEFYQEVIDNIQNYQGVFINQFNTALKYVEDYKKSIEELITYQKCYEHPQDICFDIQIAHKHNLIISNCENKIRSYLFKDDKLNQLQEDKSHRGYIETICLSNSQMYFFSGGVDKIIRIWKISDKGTFELSQELKGHKDCIKSIVINSQDNQLFSTGYDQTIQIWNKCENSWQQSQSLNDHKREILQLQLSQNDKNLISVSWDRSINIYQSISKVWKMIQKIENAHQYDIFSVCFINDEQFVTGSREVIIWQRNSSTGLFTQSRILQSNLGCVDRIKFYPILKIMISQNSYAVDIWRFVEIDNPLQIQRLKGLYQGSILTNDGQYLIAYNVDNKKIIINRRLF
ncbi:unnamed protein product [Paramecium primaurelia]|uniref:Uncharacterized protein n=1 Tax=Paramecium primaurelia TaxID=5886 RepID=A0A8S1PPW2_PARPR|nr:unnamed protein product [Paramecium primaurelia]